MLVEDATDAHQELLSIVKPPCKANPSLLKELGVGFGFQHQFRFFLKRVQRALKILLTSIPMTLSGRRCLLKANISSQHKQET